MKKILAILIVASMSITYAFAVPNKVVPIGRTAGITIMYEGVLVAGLSQVDSTDGFISPAQEIGLEQGDLIKEIDGKTILSNDDIAQVVSQNQGKTVSILYERNGEIETQNITPVCDNIDGNYKIGVWVRDSMAGIGTITYIDPETNIYGGLGHSISDSFDKTTIKNGSLIPSTVENIVKGEIGKAGEINAQYDSNTNVGSVEMNSGEGIFGKTNNNYFDNSMIMDVAEFEEITQGEAYILTNVQGGIVEKYSIEIVSLNQEQNENKNFMITITDKELIEITGGIVQGMSGSPIIQNDKIIGAVTHVLVNDPTTGYGIYIGNMLETAESIAQ